VQWLGLNPRSPTGTNVSLKSMGRYSNISNVTLTENSYHNFPTYVHTYVRSRNKNCFSSQLPERNLLVHYRTVGGGGRSRCLAEIGRYCRTHGYTCRPSQTTGCGRYRPMPKDGTVDPIPAQNNSLVTNLSK